MILKRLEKDNKIKAMYASSTICATIFDTTTKELTVIFNNGGQYKYPNVSLTDYTRIEISESTGSDFNTHIKKKYTEFEKLDKLSDTALAAILKDVEDMKAADDKVQLASKTKGMNNVDKQYQDLLTKILEKGRQKGDRTGTGTISIPFAAVEFDMSEGFPLLTTKKVFTKAIVHELLWFLKGDTNVKGLEEHNVSIWTSDAYREYTKEWMKINPPMSGPYTEKMLTKEEFTLSLRDPSTKGWDLGPVYGAQWRRWKSYDKHKQSPEEFEDVIYIDQIQQVMDKLINNPDDRRIMVSAWNVAEIDKMALPPCHYCFQLYSEELTLEERIDYYLNTINFDRDIAYLKPEFLDENNVPKRRLSLIWDQRSCDTFLGIPFNIASYGILLHMFAQQANMVPDRLIGSLKNVHVYNNHIDQCKEQIAREPRELPRIVLNKAKDIFSYTYDDIQILDYNPHDKITGAISV